MNSTEYYRNNPEAAARKVAYQKKVNARPEEKKRRAELNRERRRRGIDGKGGPDVSHTKSGKTVLEDPHTNRGRQGAGGTPKLKQDSVWADGFEVESHMDKKCGASGIPEKAKCSKGVGKAPAGVPERNIFQKIGRMLSGAEKLERNRKEISRLKKKYGANSVKANGGEGLNPKGATYKWIKKNRPDLNPDKIGANSKLADKISRQMSDSIDLLKQDSVWATGFHVDANLSVGRGEKQSVEEGGGLTAKGRAKYNRETGSNLKAPVTGKVKPGSKAAKRRKSFCGRSRSWTGERGKAARRRWKCRNDSVWAEGFNQDADGKKCGASYIPRKEKCTKSGNRPSALTAGAIGLGVGLAGVGLMLGSKRGVRRGFTGGSSPINKVKVKVLSPAAPKALSGKTPNKALPGITPKGLLPPSKIKRSKTQRMRESTASAVKEAERSIATTFKEEVRRVGQIGNTMAKTGEATGMAAKTSVRELRLRSEAARRRFEPGYRVKPSRTLPEGKLRLPLPNWSKQKQRQKNL